jgi:RsiW-degrading membrane proteinase PrsW (M82 family)
VVSLVVWAVAPPLIVLLIYDHRIRATPPLKALMLLFGIGILVGWLALGLEWMFDAIARLIPQWRLWTRTLPGLLLRQMGVIAPVEEACKLVGVVLPLSLILRRYRRVPAQPSTVLLAVFSVALGFAAQENLLALWSGKATVVDRAIGAPMHALFSAPWGWALGVALCRTIRWQEYSYRLVMGCWMLSCIWHASSNCLVYLTQLSRYAWLVYFLFAGWLWLAWRTEVLLAQSQGDVPPRLISSPHWPGRLWQAGLGLVVLGLGGGALSSLRDLGNGVIYLWGWEQSASFDSAMMLFVGRQLLQTLIMATLAGLLFRYLWRSARESP